MINLWSYVYSVVIRIIEYNKSIIHVSTCDTIINSEHNCYWKTSKMGDFNSVSLFQQILILQIILIVDTIVFYWNMYTVAFAIIKLTYFWK